MFAGQVTAWADANVGDVWLDRDEHTGDRIVIEGAPIIAIRPEWFRTHGWSAIFEDDGTLCLDTAGQWRYRKLRELPDGRTAYERITT